MRIDCIADLHGHYPTLEGGDLLIIAGDLTAQDKESQYFVLLQKLAQEKYEKIIIVAGNHDTCLQKDDWTISWAIDSQEIFTYLCDSGTEFEGLKIWGSPWSPWFPGINPLCKSFVLSDEALYDKWMMIPKRTDILITHTPAYGTLDYRELFDGTRYHMGSKTLEAWIKYVERPLLHCFGHIHEGYGIAEEYATYNDKMMKSVNCSFVDEKYRPVNKPIRIEL